MMPPSPDVRKRPATNSQPLIGPSHGHKHADLCEHLRKKQVADLAQVSESGTGILGWFSTTLSDLVYYLFVWFPRTWWITLTSLPSFLLDPIGLWSALIFALGTTVMLFVSLIVRYVAASMKIRRSINDDPDNSCVTEFDVPNHGLTADIVTLFFCASTFWLLQRHLEAARRSEHMETHLGQEEHWLGKLG